MKPTGEQMRSAEAAAENMRDAGEDALFLAKAFLYLKHRNDCLEEVFAAAERYVKFGMDEGEHKRLVRAIEQARAAEWTETGETEQKLGLSGSS